MRDNMPCMVERIVKYFLKRLYYNSPHVRVPEPGEVLYQGPSYSDCNGVSGESGEGPEVAIIAASCLRQYQDMMTSRVMPIRGRNFYNNDCARGRDGCNCSKFGNRGGK